MEISKMRCCFRGDARPELNPRAMRTRLHAPFHFHPMQNRAPRTDAKRKGGLTYLLRRTLREQKVSLLSRLRSNSIEMFEARGSVVR
jgi:hypothetical protein